MPNPNQPEVKEYTKQQFRAILSNPNIDTSNAETLKQTKYKKSHKRFYQEVHPVIEKDCKDLISLDKFKSIRIIPKKVVKRLFEKLL